MTQHPLLLPSHRRLPHCGALARLAGSPGEPILLPNPAAPHSSAAQEDGTGDGVRREWFRLLAAELADPHTGLFESHDGGATFSPAPHASVQCEDDGSGGRGGGDGGRSGGSKLRKFELVGCMLGLAILQAGLAGGCAAACWPAGA